MSVYNVNNNSSKKSKMFFGEKLGIARYDILTHPMLDTLTKKQRGFFWQPEEIQNIIKDKEDFKKLTQHEQHIFTSNLKRQILLDSVQGRGISESLAPVCSLPELEIWLKTWEFSETVHSYSYTHIIRNVYANPSKIFDEINDIQEIIDCAKDITKYYDDLIEYNKVVELYNYDYIFDDNVLKDIEFPQGTKLNQKEHKRRLWLCLNSINILEGVRFYVSFACSWAFAERKLMEGNAKIIKLIARDENCHLASTQYILRALVKEDEDFAKIAIDTQQECIKMFESAVEQEKLWAKFLFKDGSMIGLNENILCDYVEYIAKERMKAIGLPCDYEINNNPLPWTTKWISGREVQDAPQEVTKSQYTLGNLKSDVKKDSFKDVKL